MVRKLAVPAVIVAFAVGAACHYLYFSESLRKEACSYRGGRWVAGRQQCQTRGCYDAASCLPSYNNSAVCRALPAGITERELVFHLGQPIGADGRVLLFTAGPTAERPIRVVMGEGRVAEQFDCGGPESNNGMHPTPRHAASHAR